jgi:hypothetical protein
MSDNKQIGLASNALKQSYYYITNLLELDENESDNIILLEYDKFKSSWNNLEIDNYMSDGGKYRYRRYSVVNCYNGNELEYLPPEPHYQKIVYNNLNGDIFRHYAAFEEHILKSFTLKLMINLSCKIFNQIKPENLNWRVECHQFRIIPSADTLAFPTPEGRHRDGVDYVFMMLIERENITGGVTKIYNNANSCIATHTLKSPQECILLDDTKVMHEVSHVNHLSSSNTAYRDVLVLTFRSLSDGSVSAYKVNESRLS